MSDDVRQDRVFDGDYLRLTRFITGGRKLLVTFDFRLRDREGFVEARHSRQYATKGYDQLSLRSSRNDWFINRDTAAAETVISQVAFGYDEVAMLGFSMGGYGAFRYAQAARATRVLAISPQFSIHPQIVPFEHRYPMESARFNKELGDLTCRTVRGLQGIVLYDSAMLRDANHARMLELLYPDLRLVPLRHGGHPATGVLRESRRIGVLSQALTDPKGPKPEPILSTHRMLRRESPRYLKLLANHAKDRHNAVTAWAVDRLGAMGITDLSNLLDEDAESS